MNIHCLSDKLFDMPKKPTPFNKAVGKRLERLRKAEGHETMRSFAKVIGVDEDRYRSWEKGLNGLPPDMAIHLENRFGATIAWLYRDDPKDLRVGLFERIKKVAA